MVALPTLSMLLTCDDTVSFVELGLMIGNANTTRSWFFNGGEKLSISRNELCVYYVEMHGSWYRDCQRVSSTGRSTARKNSIPKNSNSKSTESSDSTRLHSRLDQIYINRAAIARCTKLKCCIDFLSIALSSS